MFPISPKNELYASITSRRGLSISGKPVSCLTVANRREVFLVQGTYKFYLLGLNFGTFFILVTIAIHSRLLPDTLLISECHMGFDSSYNTKVIFSIIHDGISLAFSMHSPCFNIPIPVLH